MPKIEIECPSCGERIQIPHLASFYQCPNPDCRYEMDQDELEELIAEYKC